MNSIQHVVFDVGNVLLHYEPDRPFRDLIPDPQERAWFLANVCSPDWNLEQDRGRSWPEAEAELISEFPNWVDHIRAFRQRWIEMVPHSYDAQVAIMTGLIENGADVTLLTNFNQDTFEEARAKYDFLDAPRGATVSGTVRCLKPEREIYDLHVDSFDLDPASTIFIDDSAANVAGAIASGWQAVQFIDSAGLERDLNSYGVI